MTSTTTSRLLNALRNILGQYPENMLWVAANIACKDSKMLDLLEDWGKASFYGDEAQAERVYEKIVERCQSLDNGEDP